MDKFELSARQMQVIMMALYTSEEFEEEASSLHDELVTERFDRFEATKSATLQFKSE